MLLKIKLIKSKHDCEEFLYTLMKIPFRDQCVRKFNSWKLPIPKLGTIHAAFTHQAENPFDFVIWKQGKRIHTNSFIEAVKIIWENRKIINTAIENYN